MSLFPFDRIAAITSDRFPRVKTSAIACLRPWPAVSRPRSLHDTNVIHPFPVGESYVVRIRPVLELHRHPLHINGQHNSRHPLMPRPAIIIEDPAACFDLVNNSQLHEQSMRDRSRIVKEFFALSSYVWPTVPPPRSSHWRSVLWPTAWPLSPCRPLARRACPAPRRQRSFFLFASSPWRILLTGCVLFEDFFEGHRWHDAQCWRNARSWPAVCSGSTGPRACFQSGVCATCRSF